MAGLGVRVFGLGGLVARLGWSAVWRRLSFGSEAQSLAFAGGTLLNSLLFYYSTITLLNLMFIISFYIKNKKLIVGLSTYNPSPPQKSYNLLIYWLLQSCHAIA